MIEYVKSDLIRYYGRYSRKLLVKGLITNQAFRVQYGLRMIQDTGINKVIGMLWWCLTYSLRKRICLPRTLQVGYGLYIGHNGPIIINPSAKIGNNCNLSQFTTIGSNDGMAATIGDNTYIGPNVCIVEDVKIGSNVTIGAGSVVTKNIPDNATAVGNYAKVINYSNPGRYIKNRYPIKDKGVQGK